LDGKVQYSITSACAAGSHRWASAA
jgi:hypothetical protein